MKLTNWRREKSATGVVMFFALTMIAVSFAVVSNIASSSKVQAQIGSNETLVLKGSQLYAEGCSSCHGLQGQGGSDGPTLAGVGAASVHFQVATGRMPLAAPGAQAMRKPPVYSEEEILALAAYISTFGPGPAIPAQDFVDQWVNASVAEGGELYRTNCAQCHNFAGSGGALTDGKYAPGLMAASPQEIYEAMITGPQAMPKFSDATLTPEDKLAVIRYIEELKKQENPGGLSLGRLGPVVEGLFIWTIGLGLLIGFAWWIGARVR